MKIEQLYTVFSRHPDIVIDSRKCKKGSLFFALKGEHQDGNIYALQALEKGCAYAVVSDPRLTGDDERLILVKDTLETLQKLARFHREKLDVPVIAVTGTNGKTTTKELIVAVLSRKFNVTGTLGNYNNHIGLPLTLLTADKNTEVLVTEMGANHPGEIALLCHIADPSHGLITNIGRAHLEGFGTFENIIKTKTELYTYLRKKGGVAFYNSGNEILSREVTKVHNRISYGLEGSGAMITFRSGTGQDGMVEILWNAPDKKRNIKTHLYGEYNAENIMAAIAVGVGFGVEPQKIVQAVSSYIPGNMRSQVVRTEKGNTVILDTYNANPASMQNALEAFAAIGAEKKAVILGDMLELGEYSLKEHRRILELLKEKNIAKEVYLVGDVFFRLADDFGYPGYRGKEGLKAILKEKMLQGYTLLVKGSRLMNLEEVMEEL